MINFNNPGHREAFQRLGILAQGQNTISSDDLAQKIIESERIEEILYLLRQELATYASKFHLLDDTLKLVRHRAENIRDKTSLKIAEAGVQDVLLTLQESTEQTELVENVAITLENAIKTKSTFAERLSPVSKEHLVIIRQFTRTLPQEARQKAKWIIDQITSIAEVIEEKRRGLEQY